MKRAQIPKEKLEALRLSLTEVRKSEYEHSSFPVSGVELREDDSGAHLMGYASVFDRPSVPFYGNIREYIRPGSFTKSLASKDEICALFNHDTAQVLGRRSKGTLSLMEDKRGLRVEITPPDTQVGRDTVTLVKRGDVQGMSFGFTVRKGGEAWEEDKGQLRRIISDVRLIEVSPVTFPAYPQTTISARGVFSGMDLDNLTNSLVRLQHGFDLGSEHKSTLRMVRSLLDSEGITIDDEQQVDEAAMRRRRLKLLELETQGY